MLYDVVVFLIIDVLFFVLSGFGDVDILLFGLWSMLCVIGCLCYCRCLAFLLDGSWFLLFFVYVGVECCRSLLIVDVVLFNVYC